MIEVVRRTRREGLGELAEDALGFGGQEIRLTRDLVLRPRAVLDAYDAHGSTAGGRYPKPFRYFVTLYGVYLLLIALLGGFERSFNALPTDMLAGFARRAGKSLEAFSSDMDKWFSLLSLPFSTLFIGGAVFLLIRRWNPGDDREDFRQTFIFMSAWSLYGMPFGLTALFNNDLMIWTLPLSLALVALIYARLGAGRWWRTRAGAWSRGVQLVGAITLAQLPAAAGIWAVTLAAASFLP